LLAVSNVVFAVGLVFLSFAPGSVVLIASWLILGVGMGMGLYEAALATLTRMYGYGARRPITGITLIAGFANTIGWPITAYLDATMVGASLARFGRLFTLRLCSR